MRRRIAGKAAHAPRVNHALDRIALRRRKASDPTEHCGPFLGPF
jgi:hypothetical protein